jgi:enolase 1/2/3
MGARAVTRVIEEVIGRRVWDSRGRPTVEVEVRLSGKAIGRAIAPAGASTGSGEAVDLRDGGARFEGYGVNRAVAHVNGELRTALLGLDAADQAGVDATLARLDGSPHKERLGANALIAASMAVAHAAAGAGGVPLWRHLHPSEGALLPLPQIQIFGGGAHAGRRVDVQDFMVVPLGAGSFAEALEWTAEVYVCAGRIMEESGRRFGVADEGGYWPAFTTNEEALETLLRAIERAGYAPGEQIAIALDIAATQFGRAGRYRLALEDKELDSDAMIALLMGWLDRYPIVSIEDPLAEDDVEGMRHFTHAVGDRIQIVGDDFLVTNAQRVRAAAAQGACNTLLVKPNQAGTLSETRAALEAARDLSWGAIASARSGETEDVTIVHLAVGWGISQLKVGSFSRSERMAKWNEGLRIEESLGARSRFAGRDALASLRAHDRH